MRQGSSGASALALGRRLQRKAATRRDLLAAGRRLFSEKGLYDSRVEDLTRTAGIAKGTLYQYFCDKEALILAVVSEGFEELHHWVERRTSGAATLQELRMRTIEAHLDFFDRHQDLMRIFHQVRGMLKFERRRWQLFRAPLRLHIERIANRLGAVRESEGWSRERQMDHAMAMFGMVSGLTSVRAALRPEVVMHLDNRTLSRACALALGEAAPGRSGRRRGGGGAAPARSRPDARATRKRSKRR